MQDVDPYSPDEPVYECYECGERVHGQASLCPECEGTVKNIAVPRE